MDRRINETYRFSHETITAHGPPLGQTAVYDIPAIGPTHNTLQLLTPVFHYINALTSFPTSNTRFYNMFSLTSGFANGLKLSFNASYEGLGNLLIEANVKRQISDIDYFEGRIDVVVTRAWRFKVPRYVFSKKNSAGGPIEYTRIAQGVMRFAKRRFEMTARENERIGVTIWGTAYTAVDSDACLLGNRSIVESDRDIFKVVMGMKSFCNTACPHSSQWCTLYCLDYPILESKNPRTLSFLPIFA